jgi:hypothetical protein
MFLRFFASISNFSFSVSPLYAEISIIFGFSANLKSFGSPLIIPKAVLFATIEVTS